jgi:hypothetical protein
MSSKPNPNTTVHLGAWAPPYYRNKAWTLKKIEGDTCFLEWDDSNSWQPGEVRCGRHVIELSWNTKTNELVTLCDIDEE